MKNTPSKDTYSKEKTDPLLQRQLLKFMSILLVRLEDSTIAYATQAVEKMFGYEPGELIGCPLKRLYPGVGNRTAEEVSNGILARIRAEDPWVTEAVNVKKDAKPVRCLAHISSFKHPKYGPVCMVMYTDITGFEEKGNHADLKDSKALYQYLVEEAGDIIFQTDQNGRFTYFNKFALEKTGYSRKELMGRHYLDLIRSDYREIAGRFYGRQFVKRIPRTIFRFPLVAKGGREIWLEQIANLFSEEDRIGGFHAIARDITEVRRSEEELKAYAARLEALNRDLEDFTFIAAHDLQEPLRKIQVFSDRVIGRYAPSLDESGRHYLTRLGSSAKRMQELIKDLRVYSTLKTDVSSNKKVDLKKIVQKVLSDLKTRVQETGARIEIGDLPFLEANPRLIRLLFQNLLSNAITFRSETELVVRISSRKLDSGVQIKVEDNGIGFEEKYADRIFKPFKRLHQQAGYEGTGMGLAICRKIVERHGGTITARSTPGRGSTFIIHLPVSQKEHDSRD
jgi:two-component system, LuxR family, sensor kinase FixL